MAKIGDRVKVRISGATLEGTLHVQQGTAVSVNGEIVEDLGDNWLVQLAISVGDKNRMVVPKGAEVVST